MPPEDIASLFSTEEDARRRHQPHKQLRHGITTGRVFRQKRFKRRDKPPRAVVWGDQEVEEMPLLGGDSSPQGELSSAKQAWGESSGGGDVQAVNGAVVPKLDFNAKRNRRREGERVADRAAAVSSRGGLFSHADSRGGGTMGVGADMVVLPTEGLFSKKVGGVQPHYPSLHSLSLVS